MVLTVDSRIAPAVLNEISQEIGAQTVRVADFDS